MVAFIGSSSAFDAHFKSPVLERIEQLIPEVTARADEIEQSRGLPADLNRKLVQSGAMRMAIPKFYGGLDLHPLATLRVLETLAHADASVAWTVMVAVGFNYVMGRFSRSTTDKLFAAGPDVLCRGALAPHGAAVPQDGGYVVSGRWPLASANYEHAWVAANTIVMENGKPRMLPGDVPDIRLCLVPAGQATFIDTWDAVGLRGSSSHDFVIKDVYVREDMTANLFVATSDWNSPLYNLPMLTVTGPTHSAVALGIAQGALDDLLKLAANKRSVLSPSKLADDPALKLRVGELAGRLAMTRDAVYSDQLASYDIGAAKRAQTAVEAAKTNVVTVLAHRECAYIVEQCLELGGSSGIYNKSLLQRRWRDMRCAAQHAGALGMSSMRFQALGGAALAQAVLPT